METRSHITLEEAQEIIDYCNENKCTKNCLAHEKQFNICGLFINVNPVLWTPEKLVKIHREFLLKQKLDRI